MKVLDRRGFFKTASATAATAALPTGALAYQAPITETPEPELPDWFKRLCAGEGDHVDYVRPWQDTPLTRDLARQIQTLHDTLIDSSPMPVEEMLGFQLRWIDGIPVGVWATGYGGHEHLHHRPEFGWNQRMKGGLV